MTNPRNEGTLTNPACRRLNSATPMRKLWKCISLVLAAGIVPGLAQDNCREGAAKAGQAYRDQFASNKPFVKVRLNGSRPLHFILDTGSPLAAIDSTLVGALGFSQESILSRSGGAGESGGLIARLQPKACEEMGGARLANGTVMSLDLSSVSTAEGVRVDGLLGGDFFRRYVIVVDYQQQTVVVLDPSFAYRGSGFILPVTLEGNHMFVSASLRKASGEAVEGRFMVDTGVRVALLLNAPFASRTEILRGQSAVSNMTLGIGAGGETRGSMFKLAKLQWGPMELDDVIAFASTDTRGVLADPGFAGIIGAEVLRRYKLFLDYPHSRIILEKTPASGSPFTYDASGIFLVGDGPQLKRIKVLRVLRDSPADSAGVREGDLVESIDGAGAAQLGLAKVRQMFTEKQREYSLRLSRHGSPLSIALKTRDLLG